MASPRRYNRRASSSGAAAVTATASTAERAKRTPAIDDRDWSALTLGQRIRQLEVEGYLVLPDLLDASHVGRLKAQTATLETTAVDYSPHQRGKPNLQFHGGLITDLIAHEPTLAF